MRDKIEPGQTPTTGGRKPPPVKRPDNSNVPLAPSVLARLGQSTTGKRIEDVLLDPFIYAVLYGDGHFKGMELDVEKELILVASRGTVEPYQVFLWCDMNLKMLVEQFSILPHVDDVEASLAISKKIATYAMVHSVVLKALLIQTNSDNPGWKIV